MTEVSKPPLYARITFSFATIIACLQPSSKLLRKRTGTYSPLA
jgi:hypothetical protein